MQESRQAIAPARESSKPRWLSILRMTKRNRDRSAGRCCVCHSTKLSTVCRGTA